MLAEAAFKMSRLLLLVGRHERQKAADAKGGDAIAAISAENDPSPSRWQRWRHYAQQVVGRWAYEACVEPANHSAADAAAPPSQQLASTAVQAQICLAAARFSVELGQNRKAMFYLRGLARVHAQPRPGRRTIPRCFRRFLCWALPYLITHSCPSHRLRLTQCPARHSATRRTL